MTEYTSLCRWSGVGTGMVCGLWGFSRWLMWVAFSGAAISRSSRAVAVLSRFPVHFVMRYESVNFSKLSLFSPNSWSKRGLGTQFGQSTWGHFFLLCIWKYFYFLLHFPNLLFTVSFPSTFCLGLLLIFFLVLHPVTVVCIYPISTVIPCPLDCLLFCCL